MAHIKTLIAIMHFALRIAFSPVRTALRESRPSVAVDSLLTDLDPPVNDSASPDVVEEASFSVIGEATIFIYSDVLLDGMEMREDKKFVSTPSATVRNI